jgi:hypothetical protein
LKNDMEEAYCGCSVTAIAGSSYGIQDCTLVERGVVELEIESDGSKCLPQVVSHRDRVLRNKKAQSICMANGPKYYFAAE